MTTPIAQTDDRIERALATLRMARGLAEAGREIDLSGLDEEIGRICAAALDLPIDEGRRLHPRLDTLAAELGRLSDALIAP